MLLRLLVIFLILILAVGIAFYLLEHRAEICRVCERPMHAAIGCSVHLTSGETVKVCCPRCAFRFQQGRSDVEVVTVADFNSGRELEAPEAFFVEGSAVHLCCVQEGMQKDQSGSQFERTWDRCLPSLISFETYAAAEEFSAMYGGRVVAPQESDFSRASGPPID